MQPHPAAARNRILDAFLAGLPRPGRPGSPPTLPMRTDMLRNLAGRLAVLSLALGVSAGRGELAGSPVINGRIVSATVAN